ncbi:MAG: succinylglutamate desuccinylase/aspartoacylase family protein [Gammaproteobacteria bacterium]
MRQTETIELALSAAGTARSLTVWRWGTPGARPKAYVQASLHADEIPGMLVTHHLSALLDKAMGDRAVTGEVVLVPVANPLGLTQRVHGVLHGRFELSRHSNFNRGFPAFAEVVAGALEGRLGDDEGRNVSRVRAALMEAAGAHAAGEAVAFDEAAGLRARLMCLAIDADIVLDLHCDTESLVYVYLGTPLWPQAADLPRWLGSPFALLAEDSGGQSFDEAVAGPWWALARRFADKPIPPACLSATVELRGQADVSDELAMADAAALAHFLAGRGVIDAGALPAVTAGAHQPAGIALEGVDLVRAAGPGILVHRAALGDEVKRGDTVAELVDPIAPDPASARLPLTAGTGGIVFTRTRERYVSAGAVVAKIAGTEPLEYRRAGSLLED